MPSPQPLRLIGPLAVLLVSSCGKPGPPEPGQLEFAAASDKIRSSSAGKARHGSTTAAVVYAGEVAEMMAKADRELFAGQDENRTRTLADEFMVYAHHSKHGVVFLVHVPQFKRYQDEVREQLLQAAWQAAHDATSDLHRGQPINLGVGLRGTLSYGAIAVGLSNELPAVEFGESLTPSHLYPFFVGGPIEPPPNQPVVDEPPPVEAAPAPILTWEVLYSEPVPLSTVTTQLGNYEDDINKCVDLGAAILQPGQRFDVRLVLDKKGRVKKVAAFAGHEGPEVIMSCLATAATNWEVPAESLRKQGGMANIMFRWGELPPP